MSEYIFPQSDTLAESYPKLQEELKRQNEEDKRLQREITANKADIEKKLEQHKTSDDHTADKIRYDGKIPKDNVKDALDETDTRIDNIVSQGGSDNTEVVDARHSTTKDKTYNTLKGRLEDGEQDIEKLKTDTNVAESVTETSYDSVIPVPDSAINGQVSGVVRGLTATNIIKNGDFSNTDSWSLNGVSDFKTIDNVGIFTVLRQWGQIYQQIENFDIGDKVYLSGYIKADSQASFTLKHKSGYNTINLTHSGSGDFEHLSGVGTIPPDTDEDFIRVAIQDNQSSDWTPIYVTKVTAINLTLLFGKGNEPTKEWCDVYLGFVSGAQSTIGSARVKSVGKNLFDPFGKSVQNWVFVSQDSISGTHNSSYHRSIYTNEVALRGDRDITKLPKLQGGKKYFLTGESQNAEVAIIDQYGKYVTTWSFGNSYTSDTDFYIDIKRVDPNLNDGYFEIDNLMIAYDNSSYEPYTEDRAYVTAVKDGKIVNLRSLPNGIKDEIRASEGKLIKRVSDALHFDGNSNWRYDKAMNNCYVFRLRSASINNVLENSQGSLCINNKCFQYAYDYYLDEEHHYCFGNQLIVFINKDTIDSIDGESILSKFKNWLQKATLTYQLAEPEIIPIRWTGLQAYENGTIYVDTVIPELGFYYDNGLESHYPDQPIKEVDTLYRVDKETGYREPLDVSKCEIREDRLSFTHPDLEDGDLCDWDYVPMTESTRPETSLVFPTNLKASVNSLLDAEQINKKEHNIFKARLDNHDRDIERIDTDIENAQTAIDATQSDIDHIVKRIKKLPIYNVMNYGAKGDGTTHDADAIQSAIDAAYNNGGGTVYFPEGTYILEKTPLIKSNCHLVGVGEKSVLKGYRPGDYKGNALIANDGIDASGYNGARNWSIRGFAIDSPDTNGIVVIHADNVKISDIYGKNIYHHYVDISGRNVICQNLHLGGNSDMSPFQIDSLEGAQKIWDGAQAVVPNYDGTISDNIHLRDSVLTTRPNLTTPMRNSSIHLHNYAGKNIYIENVITSGADIGIYKDANSKWDNVNIKNCIFKNKKKGILFEESDKISEGLVITDCIVEGIKEEGLIFNDYKNITIDGYTIKNGNGNGIEIGNVYDCTLQNTNIKLTRQSTSEIGIFIKGGENITLDKATIEGATEDGIRVGGDRHSIKHLNINNISLKNLNSRGIRLRPLETGASGEHVTISSIEIPLDSSFIRDSGYAVLGIYEGWEDVHIHSCSFVLPLIGISDALVVVRGIKDARIANCSFKSSLEGDTTQGLRFQGDNGYVAIANCLFESVHRGVNAFSNSSGGLSLSNSHFRDCETGIHVADSSTAKVAYSGAFFYNCDTNTSGDFIAWNNS